MTPRWILPVVLIIVALVLGRAYWIGSRKTHDERMRVAIKTTAGFTKAMSEIAAFAVDDAKKEFDVTLDYSPKSVEFVESILGKLHDQHTQKPLTNKEITKRAMRFGVYVGEVIRRKKGGTWKAFEPTDYDPMAFQITYKNYEGKDGTSFPVNWCGKRILNGPEDNVWHKYLMLVEGGGKVLTFPIHAFTTRHILLPLLCE